MSDKSWYLIAYDEFSRKLLEKFPDPPINVKILVEQNFDLSLDELNTISHDNDEDIVNLMFTLILFRLKGECPIGIRAIEYIDLFSYMSKQDFSFKESMIAFYSSTLNYELMNCNDINDLKQFMIKLQEIKLKGIDFQSAIYTVYIKTM